MPMRFVVLFVLFCAVSLPARGEIYECVDQNGTKRFTNIVADARGCKALNIGSVASAPAPQTAPAPKPQVRVPQAVTTPASFPRVERQVQRERDNDRRRILEHELVQEEKLLADAQKELSQRAHDGSDDSLQKKVRLHATNVASLRKEISKIR